MPVQIYRKQQVTNQATKGTKTFAKLVGTLDRDGKLTAAIQYYRAAKGTATAPVRKAGYLLVRGGSTAAEPVVSVARTTGKSYRVWQLTRQLEGGVCPASISIASCGDFLAELSPTQRQEFGRLLVELDDDGVRLANELGPRETDRLLAHYVDDYEVVEEGLVMHGSRHGIKVEARYVDDGEAFVADLADGEDLSKGAIGEEAAYAMAEERNYEVPDWFEKKSEYQNGIDLIAEDKDTGQWVFIESKFSSSRGSVGIGDLGDTKTKGRQMSNEWIEESLEQMRDDGEISNSRYFELLDALEDNSRKEMVVTKNTQQSGFTVAESLNDVGIDSVVVNKIGSVVG